MPWLAIIILPLSLGVCRIFYFLGNILDYYCYYYLPSDFKVQTAVLSELCVMFQVYIIIVIIVVVVIIIIIIIVSFMQGIYTYILETNYVPREYSVAAIIIIIIIITVIIIVPEDKSAVA